MSTPGRLLSHVKGSYGSIAALRERPQWVVSCRSCWAKTVFIHLCIQYGRCRVLLMGGVKSTTHVQVTAITHGRHLRQNAADGVPVGISSRRDVPTTSNDRQRFGTSCHRYVQILCIQGVSVEDDRMIEFQPLNQQGGPD